MTKLRSQISTYRNFMPSTALVRKVSRVLVPVKFFVVIERVHFLAKRELVIQAAPVVNEVLMIF